LRQNLNHPLLKEHIRPLKPLRLYTCLFDHLDAVAVAHARSPDTQRQSLTLATIAFMDLVGFDNALHQRMTDHIFGAKVCKRNSFDGTQNSNRMTQT